MRKLLHEVKIDKSKNKIYGFAFLPKIVINDMNKEMYAHDWKLVEENHWKCSRCGENQQTTDEETPCLLDGEKIYVIKSGKIILNGKYNSYQEAVHQMGIIKGNKQGNLKVCVYLKKGDKFPN